VDEEVSMRGEVGKEVFPPAFQAGDSEPGEGVDHRRHGMTEPGFADDDFQEFPTHPMGFDAAPGGFDFG
jgi:hypothetical protein